MPKFETRNSEIVKPEMNSLDAVRDFKDLVVWKLARELRVQIYALVKKFPPEERFALNTQMRRAAQSIGANIAEGFGRYSYRENIQYCRQARGSAFEIRDHLVTAVDAAFITKDEYAESDALAQRVIQTINGYIRSTNTRLAESKRGS
jgi:four helix bundle protein